MGTDLKSFPHWPLLFPYFLCYYYENRENGSTFINVIPTKVGIQKMRWVLKPLDPGFRRGDEFLGADLIFVPVCKTATVDSNYCIADITISSAG
jgi:hypothetical protein